MELIKRGAEADIYEMRWFGRPAVSKVRTPKPYRNPDLDGRLRRQRTLREADMLHSAKSLGISTPLVYFVDPGRYTIIMEKIQGPTVHSLPGGEIIRHCRAIGEVAGLLHSAGIMHGDLTTSNFVSGDRLYLLDMGLSRRTTKPEDWAVDMRLVKEILSSAHAAVMEEAWGRLVEGYASAMGSSSRDRVLRLVSEIEARGRYARVV